MKIAFIFPVFRVKTSKFDGLPLSTPMVVGNLRSYFSDLNVSQIDLNNEVDLLLKNKLIKRRDFESILKKTRDILSLTGLEKRRTTGNRVGHKFYIPTENDLAPFCDFFSDLYKKLDLDKFDIFFLSVYQIHEENILSMLLLAKFFKNKKKTVIVGGMRNLTAGFIAEKMSGNLSFIDSVVGGNNGFVSTKELLDDLRNNKNLKNVYSSEANFENNLVLPDYSSFQNMENFRIDFGDIEREYDLRIKRKNKENILLVPYKFSFGCFWGKCLYCSQSSGTRFYFKKISEIISDIKKLKNTCKTRYFIFYNNNFNFNLDFSKKLLQKMIDERLNIIWTDSFNLRFLDKELIELLVGAGCIRMDMGLVTLNNDIQKYYNNIVQDDECLENLKNISNSGIWTDVSFIANLPHNFNIDGETEKIKKIIKYIDAVTINSYRAYKSKILNDYKKYNLKIVDHKVSAENYLMPMYFIENNFTGSIEDRGVIFVKYFLKLKKIFLDNNVIFNEKFFYLLAYLYGVYGHQEKDEIKKIMNEALKIFFKKDLLDNKRTV